MSGEEIKPENQEAPKESGITAAQEMASASKTAPAPQPLSFAMAMAVSIVVSLGSLVIGMLSYHTWIAKPQQRVATVDLNEVLEIKQVQLTMNATRPGASDADRAAAYDAIGSFGKELESTLAEMQRDCGCLIMVRAAVLWGQSEDLTKELKKRLGMGDESLAKNVEKLAAHNKQALPGGGLGLRGGK